MVWRMLLFLRLVLLLVLLLPLLLLPLLLLQLLLLLLLLLRLHLVVSQRDGGDPVACGGWNGFGGEPLLCTRSEK